MADLIKVGKVEVNAAESIDASHRLMKRVFDTFFGKQQAQSSIHRAQGRAAAALIEAQSQIDIENLHNRASARVTAEEIRNQSNIEAITQLAITHLNKNAKPEGIDEDWMAYFFEKSRIVSNKEMQVLWSKILAGEANFPSSFSKKTMDLISKLEKQDANFFTKLCSFLFLMEEHHLSASNYYLFTTPDTKKLIFEAGLDFDTLNHLEDLGLIKHGVGLSSYSFTSQTRTIRSQYFEKNIKITLQPNPEFQEPSIYAYSMECSNILLTNAGQQLAKIAGPTANYSYFDNCIKYWLLNNIVVEIT